MSYKFNSSAVPMPLSMRSKDRKKKKLKSTIQASTSTIAFDDSHIHSSTIAPEIQSEVRAENVTGMLDTRVIIKNVYF